MFFTHWLRIANPRCQKLARCTYQAEDTNLFRKGKYHYMADLLFDLFGLSCSTYFKGTMDILVCLNPNQSDRRSAVQCYFSFMKYVSKCSLIYPFEKNHRDYSHKFSVTNFSFEF